MKYALISIKPIYVENIKKHIKKWEFRKFLIKDYHNIIVYETYPTKKITLLLNISEYIVDTPENIWNKCKEYAGISKKDFFEYFKGKKLAYAYKISNFTEVNENINKYNILPPRCVIYLQN